mmetsp:Transcript_13453/g.40577  ORF Transcript_13453/g.40577 Transcript_13453/m.40577 type:complete len:218 (+) Transcript_13453:139-792(+)
MLQLTFCTRISNRYRLDQLIWIDEISANEGMVHRRHGWSEAGHMCRRAGITYAGVSYSALGVFWIGGMLAAFVVEGAIDADLFAQITQHILLPQTAPWPHQRSVVIADNCGTHYFQAWIDTLTGAGRHVWFQEKLSPTLNPIEDAFKLARRWAATNYMQRAMYGDIKMFIRAALISAVEYPQARHCVLNCSTMDGTPAWHTLVHRFDQGERSPVYRG